MIKCRVSLSFMHGKTSPKSRRLLEEQTYSLLSNSILLLWFYHLGIVNCQARVQVPDPLSQQAPILKTKSKKPKNPILWTGLTQ